MYYINISVPRITVEKLDQLNSIVPDLSRVASIPVIDTVEGAYLVAQEMVRPRLATTEYISLHRPIVLTTSRSDATEARTRNPLNTVVFEMEHQWVFSLVCMGD